ncbi:helix-turn-helix transcriptional regulator [Pusillimonas sp.]|uniref:helix-turn-helix transcriptional regulator n=1 Tax=Pusillimonas sp. TaxID=3040095 RepID=UPI0037CA8B41
MTPQKMLTIERALLEGVLSDEAWNDALMLVAGQVGASYVCVTSQNELTKRLDILEPIKLPQSAIETYVNEFQALNPTNLLKTMPTEGGQYLDWVELGHRFIERSPYYQDFLKSYGLGHIMAHCVGTFGTQSCNLSLHRLAGEAAFDAGQAASLSALHGALNRSYALRHQLHSLKREQAWQRRALNALSFPVMIVDEACAVLQANRAAEAWLSEPTCPLSVKDTGSARQALLHIVRQALGESGEPPRLASVRLSFNAPQAGTTCVAIPLGEGDEETPAERYDAALLMVWPARPKAPALQLLREVFGLSLAEARVAEMLAQGHTPQKIAELRSVGESTVRSHIKSIFHKTHVGRQYDLARLLTELAVVEGRAD